MPRAAARFRQHLLDLAPQLLEERAHLKPAKCVPLEVDRAGTPDPALPWMPWQILPLSDSPAFAGCTPEQRLRYNQYYALSVAEQFVWIENALVVAPLGRLMRDPEITGPARELFESFLRDEDAHNATMWRLCHAARPDLYPGGDRYPEIAPRYRLFRPPAAVRMSTGLFAVFPRALSGWVLMLSVFEEHTLLLHRAYTDSTDTLDPVFRRVQFLHAQDEARHCKIDTLLAEMLLDPQSPAERGVNGWYLGLALRRFYDVRWGFAEPIRRWVEDFPDLRPRLGIFLRETARIRSRPAFLAHLFEAPSAPMIGRNRQRYEIFDRALRSLTDRASPAT